MDLEATLGAAPATYIGEIVARTRAVLGGDLRAVCLMGSAALGDYRPGRSDIDVAVVAERALPVVARQALVAALEHDALPCPARGLELVAYDPSGLADPRGPAYLVNLNTGPRMDRQVSFDPAENPRFWFTLDVAIGRTLGRTLLGPPPADLFPELPDGLIRDAARDSLDWWSAHGGHPFAAVLAACVAWRWSETGTWSSKGAATRWAADRAAEPDVLRAALDRREGDGARRFDEAAARRFVAMVRRELAD
jgi:hypothetical protein